MNQSPLTEGNFFLFAAQHYDNVFPDTIEFYNDLKRFAYIKRLFNHYKESGELKERLIMNHMMVIFNMWGIGAAPMLFLKLSDHQEILKTFLVYLQRMPAEIKGIGMDQRTIISSDIEECPELLLILKAL